jgi:hypothetical protein
LKTAIKLGIALIALAAMAWIGVAFHWHFKILAAVRALEAATRDDGYEPYRILRHEAGCRALPYLVRALNPEKNPYFLERATMLIAIETDVPGVKGDGWWPGSPHGKAWRIALGDSPDERKAKCEAAREFWSHEGARHHQVWRVWSRQCTP